MDLHANKVWLPGAASCLLFFGLYFLFSLLPVYTNADWSKHGFLFISIPYLAVMPFVGALGAYLSRRMKGSVVERILSALPDRTFVDSDCHHRRWPVPGTRRMALLPQR
jgi:hypothetical protein